MAPIWQAYARQKRAWEERLARESETKTYQDFAPCPWRSWICLTPLIHHSWLLHAFTCFYLVSSVRSLEESECFGSRLWHFNGWTLDTGSNQMESSKDLHCRRCASKITARSGKLTVGPWIHYPQYLMVSLELPTPMTAMSARVELLIYQQGQSLKNSGAKRHRTSLLEGPDLFWLPITLSTSGRWC